MENIKELLENFKNEIINELPKAIVNVMEMEIFFDDEIFHIDGILGILNIAHHFFQKNLTVSNQLNLIVLAVKSVSVDLIQLDQMPPVFG